VSEQGRTIGAMGYFKARSDLDFLVRFRTEVFELWGYEGRAAKKLNEEGFFPIASEWKPAVRSVATKEYPTGYQAARQQVSVDMTRAVRMARKLGVPVDYTSLPAPAFGGYPIPFNLFESVLLDPSHGEGVEGQAIVDALNRTVGAARDRVHTEAMHLINPAWWLWSLLVFVLRIPFIVLNAAGFNTDKIEDNLWSRLFKVAEVVAIAYFIAKFGLDRP
jgi:hypothetical protein